MIFKQVAVGDMQNFCYIIIDGDDCAVVDPGWDADKIKKEAGQPINKIILTHTHYDHVTALKEFDDVDIYVHESEQHDVKTGKVHPVKDRDLIRVGKTIIKVIHTPGHTEGSICLLVENKLVSGDTVFVDAIGRTDLPTSSEIDMKLSLKKISQLPENTEIWPGHDYGPSKHSTIKEQKKSNPYF